MENRGELETVAQVVKSTLVLVSAVVVVKSPSDLALVAQIGEETEQRAVQALGR